jgi:hypothetical protein
MERTARPARVSIRQRIIRKHWIVGDGALDLPRTPQRASQSACIGGSMLLGA